MVRAKMHWQQSTEVMVRLRYRQRTDKVEKHLRRPLWHTDPF